jgi:hypothetical protein
MKPIATAVAMLLSALLPAAAGAVDVSAGDLAPLPPGTNLAFLYGLYTDSNQYDLPGGGTVAGSNHLESATAIARYVHYLSIFGLTVAPQILVPYGALYNGELGGQSMASAHGIGDITLAAPVWLVNKPSATHATYVSVTPWLFLPTGSYDATTALSMGSNRTAFALQGALIQGVSSRVTVDLVGDVTWYGDNDDSGPFHQTISQSATSQIQAMAQYKINPANTVWAGWSGIWGGQQHLDGVDTAVATQTQQIRVAWQTWPIKTLELETMVGRDIHSEGGFKEAVRVQLRLMKVF